MILPLPCELLLTQYSGKGTVVIGVGKRTLVHGDPKTLTLSLLGITSDTNETFQSLITLTRGQAQQLADDINFLLG